ncbi:MAG TPA: hypothetical protein VH062_07060 [Polyangiaceae bacterium]|nr:hypothetical protein [Polyangiaceae bacterium]
MNRARRAWFALGAFLAFALPASSAFAGHAASRLTLGPGAMAWRDAGVGTIRGLTIGPIESSLHPGKGYGSRAFARTTEEARRLGANWVSLTAFGRIADLHATGIDPTFEAPFAENRRAVGRAIAEAHRRGLRVLLVPHLWVETGEWRGEVDPGTDEGWKRWAESYRRHVLAWARVAESEGAEMFAVGIELRSFATGVRAPLLSSIIADVRRTYHGLLTYAANWDDVFDTVVLGDLDVIGLNAFFPLDTHPGADLAALEAGGRDIAERMRTLAETWQKPVLFTEMGYTTRTDAAIEPWIWPDTMKSVVVDQRAQAEAYEALLSPLVDAPWFAGFFVWRIYADPDDMSQEAEWGFSPRGKEAELVVRDAFAARWGADGAWFSPGGFATRRATGIGLF